MPRPPRHGRAGPSAESEAAKIKAGLVDTRELARIVHSGHPLDDHFTEYRASLIAKGATKSTRTLPHSEPAAWRVSPRSTDWPILTPDTFKKL